MQVMDKSSLEPSSIKGHEITEGLATIVTQGHVFYNPVQEFNRDLSISVLTVFAQEYEKNSSKKNIEKTNVKKNGDLEKNTVQIIINTDLISVDKPAGVVYENGITILEALSATGLRSIRYAKEIPGVKKIIANDISQKAVESITTNVKSNGVENIVETSHSDAVMFMYSHRQQKEFDVIDLDPYGCPSIFLDAAVQAVKDGGLLLVTATDMAVLAGNCPETCYTKYGAVSLRIKACHEMPILKRDSIAAISTSFLSGTYYTTYLKDKWTDNVFYHCSQAIRILLQCIESHANRYGRFIEPLLSISADFYIRVFVKVHSGPAKCKYTTSKLSMVYHCTGCGSFVLQPLGILRKSENKSNIKFSIPTGPAVGPNCEHCNHRHHMGGPIWSGPIHSKDFVYSVLQNAPTRLGTWKRIQGVLNVIGEELDDVPLYYTLDRLSSTIHCDTPSMLLIRSAILNGGFKVSFAHTNRTSIKTNAPGSFIWDIMRCWEKSHPVKRDRLSESSPGYFILNKQMTHEINLELRPDANPQSRQQGFARFQENPTAHWGPGTRATAMVGDQKISKSKKNQGKKQRKRKRDNSNDSTSEQNKKI